MDNKKVVDLKKEAMPILDIVQVQKTIANITELVSRRAELKGKLIAIDTELKSLQDSNSLKAVMPLLKDLKSVIRQPRVKQAKKGWIKKDDKFSIDNGATFFDIPNEVSYKRNCYFELASLTGLSYNEVTLSGAVKSLIEWLKA